MRNVGKIGAAFFLLGTFITASGQTFENISEDLSLSDFKMSIYYGGGVSAEDYDNDGDIDFAVSSSRGWPNRILVNEGNQDFSEIFLPTLNFHTRAALWLDYNGDQLLDLFFLGDCLGIEESCDLSWALFKQNGNGGFEDVTEEAGLYYPNFSREAAGGVSAGDINSDGYLDIIFGHFRGPTFLLLNLRDGTFELQHDPFNLGEQKTWQHVIYDFDGDGFEDIYVSVDFQLPNQYWKHNGSGIFEDRANEFGLDHRCDDMGLALGDYDSDSDLDIYISCVQARELITDEIIQGNDLLKNNGTSYEAVGINAGVAEGGWGWGVTFMDGNNDGFPDIAATNGLPRAVTDQSKYFLNNQDGTFNDISDQVNFNDNLEATCLISVDMDRDGDLDLLQTLKADFQGYPIALFENKLQSDNNYVVIRPRMEGSNHWAIGASVRIKTTNGEQVKAITAGISTYGQEPAEAFFGLGDAARIDEVEIIWPGGGITTLFDLEPNQVIDVNDEGVLHPPLNLQVEAESSTSLVLSWDIYSVVDSYILERSLSADFDSFDSFEIFPQGTGYVDSGLEKLTQYFYRLRAKAGIEESRQSLVSGSFTSGENINAPSALQYTVTSATSVMLSWSDMADNEESFRLQRSGSGDFEFFIETILPANSTEYLDESLEPGGDYYYRLQAFSDEGVSDFSDLLFVTVDYSAVLSTVTNDLKVFPVPSDGYLNIVSKTEVIEKFVIVDVSGKAVSAGAVGARTLTKRLELSEGLYLLKVVMSSGKVETYKISIK